MKTQIALLTSALVLGTALHANARVSADSVATETQPRSAVAASREMHKADRHGKRGKRGGIKRMFRGLDLNQEQKDKIFEIRHANVPAMRDHRNQMRTLRQALRAQTTGESYDAAQVTEITNRIGALHAQMAQSRAGMMRQVFEVLTPEQRVKFQEKIAKRGDRQGKGRHGHN
jgi:Spy/CpxP family protein refolding chaperone